MTQNGDNATVTNVKRWWAAGTTVASMGPLGLWAIDIQPPWPQASKAVVGVATLFSILSAIVAWAVIPAKPRRGPVAATLILCGLSLLLLYLALYSGYVIHREQTVRGVNYVRVWVVGYERLSEYRTERLSDEDILERAAFDPEKGWTRTSLTIVRVGLLASYALAFSLLTSGIAIVGTLPPPK